MHQWGALGNQQQQRLQEYDRWETDGATFVIQDLLPEDDKEALELLVGQMAPDETLCIASKLCEDPISLRSMAEYWRATLAQRMSLACYVYKDGGKILAAVNCCLVVCVNDEEDTGKIEGETWNNVYNALHYTETRVNIFDVLATDKVLYAMGLCVRRDFRGAGLGAKMLAAREPLCRQFGIKGTATVFTGAASQRSAERAGFTTVASVTFKELADAGLQYDRDNTTIKLMVKKYYKNDKKST